MFSITGPASMISQWMIHYRLALHAYWAWGSLIVHPLGVQFTHNLNLMHISITTASRDNLVRPVAFGWQMKRRRAITGLLMTMALLCRCKLCLHLSSDQVTAINREMTPQKVLFFLLSRVDFPLRMHECSLSRYFTCQTQHFFLPSWLPS